MEKVTVSSKGQVAIPKSIRDTLDLYEGAKLTVEVRGHEIILSKDPAWRKLKGAAADRELVKDFAAFRKQERKREDSRP